MSKCGCAQCTYHNKLDETKMEIIHKLRDYGLEVAEWWDVTDLIALLKQADQIK